MNELERFTTFYDEYSDDFYEYLSSISGYLINNNCEYNQIYKEIQDVLDNNVNLQKVLDEDILEDGLSSKECSAISKLIYLYFDLQDILEKEIYFKGGMDTYYYFQKLGIIR